MTDFPGVLADLSPADAKRLIDRMRTMARSALRADAAALEAAAMMVQGAALLKQAQMDAELTRIRTGAATALLAKGEPSIGCWTRPRFPHSGWSILRIDDTGQAGGCLCEICEKAQTQHAYVLSHEAWPPDALGAEVYACRTCSAHLLAPPSRPPVAGGNNRQERRAERNRCEGEAELRRARHNDEAPLRPLHERFPNRFGGVKQATVSDNRAKRGLPQYE